MTNQEIFNKVAEGIVAQGGPAVENNKCRYRTHNGLKCAAGQLLPDSRYNPNMEGKGVRQLPTYFVDVDIPFVMGLQGIHDSCTRYDDFFPRWKLAMRTFARQMELEIPPCLA